ncbi:hypothetical protein [Microbacterium sp. 22242]|uniref:hypothetical protein n=1 Tax=Microbacterium sp. 22242 TaxID=3453896 RepID=UPI003F863313
MEIMVETQAKGQGVSIGVAPVSGLATSMAAASTQAARATLLNYTSDGLYVKLRTALEAGAATEWLVRAALARLSPSLLALRTHHDSVLALSGARTLSDPLELRTIPTSEVLTILLKAHPTMASLRSDVDFIMSVRNGAAHSGLVAAASLELAARRLVRVAEALIEEVGLTREDYWGAELAGVAAGISADFENEIAARVSSKIAAAKARLKDFVAGIPKAQLEQTLTALESRHSSVLIADDSEDHEYKCPSCERRAWVTYLRQHGEEGSLEVDYDSEGYPESASVMFEVVLVPMILQCPVCGLILDAQDDELSGLDDVEEHEGEPHFVDASEYYADQDPY